MSGFGPDLLILGIVVALGFALYYLPRREARGQRQWVPRHPPVDLDALDFRRQGGAERPERRAL